MVISLSKKKRVIRPSIIIGSSLLGAKPLPDQMTDILSTGQLDIIQFYTKTFQGNIDQNVVYKMTAILVGPHWGTI